MPSILTEAENIVNGDRQKDYGNPRENFRRILQRWKAALYNRVPNDIPADAHMAIMDFISDLDIDIVPDFMEGVKLARQIHCHKRDNLRDAAGYIECWNMLEESE